MEVLDRAKVAKILLAVNKGVDIDFDHEEIDCDLEDEPEEEPEDNNPADLMEDCDHTNEGTTVNVAPMKRNDSQINCSKKEGVKHIHGLRKK